MKKLFLALFLIAVVAGLCFAQQKFALVIGNADYTGISKLRNPVNDAKSMEAALKGLGFTVETVLNGNLDKMETAATDFKRRLGASRNAYGFFFYAGHGVQAGGDNYLIPVDATNIQSENHLRQRAVSLQTLLDNMNDAGNELNIIVLDACRDNPFGWARSGSRGLSVVHAPAGSIVMYATSAGATADDGTGANGLFTGQLLNNLKTPGLSVRDLFDKTGEDVLRVSGGRQHPELSVRFFGASSAYLGQRPSPNTPERPAPQPAPAPAVQPTPTPAPAVQPVAPPVQPAPANFVRIPGGTFQMGNPSGGNVEERSVHTVTVGGFSLGKYEVTQKEWQEVMGTNPSNFKGDSLPVENVSWYDAIEYCNKRSQKEGLTPAYTIDKSRKDPNNTSNYDDVKWVVTWNRNANGYRLPTEAEWEYAARGGNGSPGNYTYAGSNTPDGVAWYSGNSGRRTQTVGTKAANGLGLHDMTGNVWEWCWDWYGSYASGAQTGPVGAAAGAGRVMRGGSWNGSAAGVRSAFRYGITPSDRGNHLGFRLVLP